MSVEQICEIMKEIPIHNWGRVPSPLNETEPSTAKGSGKITYTAKYRDLQVEASDSFSWTTSYTEESDFWPESSQRNFVHAYQIKVSEGGKTSRVSEEDRWGIYPLGKLFEEYLERKVKNHILNKEIVRKRTEDENQARREDEKKKRAERSLLAMFTRK